MTPEKLMNNLETFKSGDKSNLIDSLKNAVKCALVKRFAEGYDRPCEINDFCEFKKKSEQDITTLKLIIEDLIKSNFFCPCNNSEEVRTFHNYPDIDIELLALIVIMCGENVYLKPWNTETTVRTCSDLLSVISKLFGYNETSQLIAKGGSKNLSKKILQILRPNLLSTTWKHFPSLVVCYKWILKMIEQPNLSPLLHFVLPTALLLVDDFVTENKIMGVECLSHIIDNVTIAELQYCGHGDVIYNALMPLLRMREADLITLTIPCLVTLTKKLEMDFGRKSVTKWSRFDSILEIILENMELEQLVALRISFIDNLQLLINASGIGIIRWSKRLMRIFREYIEIAGKNNDSRTLKYCLRAIEKYLQLSKPIVSLFGKQLLFTLLLAFHHTLTNLDCSNQSEIRNIIDSSVKIILESFSEEDKKELQIELQEKLKDNINFYQEIKKLLDNLYH